MLTFTSPSSADKSYLRAEQYIRQSRIRYLQIIMDIVFVYLCTYRMGHKTGLFVKVCESCIWWYTKVVHILYLEKKFNLTHNSKFIKCESMLDNFSPLESLLHFQGKLKYCQWHVEYSFLNFVTVMYYLHSFTLLWKRTLKTLKCWKLEDVWHRSSHYLSELRHPVPRLEAVSLSILVL